MSKNGEVGYGRPPSEFQFKPGISGNPGGRPRNARRFASDLISALNEAVSDANGNTRTKQRAIVDVLVEKALKGEAHAIATIIAESARMLGEQEADETEAPEDRAILQALSPPDAPTKASQTLPGSEKTEDKQ